MSYYREYFRIFIPIAIAFAIYSVTFVPWIDRAQVPKTRRWTQQIATSGHHWWDGLFREDAWQRQSPQVLASESGTLLFQERVEVTETVWHIKPLTILIPQRSDSVGSTRRAVVISNPEGAEIAFAQRPEWTAEPPPIESGRLLGMIQIYSPPEANSDDNGLLVETSNVRIDNRKLWTDKSIKMQMGASIIEGHYLTINLEKKLLTNDAPTNQKKTPFDGLESLELMYVDRVHIGLKNGGLWPTDAVRDAEKRTAFASLKCDGGFTFNFQQSEALFRGGDRGTVRMEHRVEGLPVDTFECSELRMQVGMDEQGSSPDRNRKSPWKLQNLQAIGGVGRTPSDHSRWLKLLAPGMQVEAHCQHLYMDLDNGEVRLSNSLPLTAARESSPVYLRRENIQVWSPEVHYRNPGGFDRSKQVSKVKRLGTIAAKGPGTAQMDDQREQWTLSWGQKLIVRPSDLYDVISIDGSANIRSNTQGSFLAEELHLWLKPVDSELAQRLSPLYENGKVPTWLPQQMHAEREVRIQTETLRANLETMDVQFDHSLPASIRNDAIATDPAFGRVPPSPESVTNPVRQPQMSSGQTANPTPSLASGSPMTVVAKSLHAVVRTSGPKSSLDALSLDGEFQLTRTMLSESSPWPFAARGTQLQMQQKSPEVYNLDLSGTPAEVNVGSGYVRAAQLRLSQSDQLFWIDQPGELVIPAEAIPLHSSPAATSLVSTPLPPSVGNQGFRVPQTVTTPTALKWRDSPKIRWGERLVFNGKTLRFDGGVLLDCCFETPPDTLRLIKVNSKSLVMDLQEKVPLQAAKPNAASPIVQSIRFERDATNEQDRVDVRVSETNLKLEPFSREHLKIDSLVIHVPSQEFQGFGPGDLWSRRFTNRSPMSKDRSTSHQLQCVHMSFRDLRGDLKTRQASFYRDVQVLLGPIATWEDQVNVHLTQRLGPNQTLIVSDEVNLFDGSELSYNQVAPVNRSAKNPAWEIQARSRVRLESMTDQGVVTMEGESLKYAAKDDVVHIAGSGAKSAVITAPNKSAMSIKSLFMQLKTGEMRGTLEGIEGVLPPTMQHATPPTATKNLEPTLPSARDNRRR